MSLKAKYDPLLFKFPKGVVCKGQTVKFHIDYTDKKEPKKVYFMLKKDEDSDYQYLEMTKNNGYEISYTFETNGHFWYNFQIVFDDFCVYLNRSFNHYSFVSNYKEEDYLQLVTEKEYECTDCLQGGIIYQIYVDRFCKEGEVETRKPLIMRDDWGGKIKKNTTDPLIINLEVFGGNISGIISKLDYLKELGVTAIYLNPISLANSNHKYDTSDYMKIDDMFGTEDDFKNFLALAKEKGMKVFIDGVYNHTGSDSLYFNREGTFDTLGAYKSKDSIFYKWYDFMEYPKVYRSWWGIDTLPSINGECEEFHEFIAGDGGVLEKFLKLGVDGVRLDVVDEINDKFVKKISKKVKEFGKNHVIMGEVWEDAATKIAYDSRRKYFSDNELNSVMNYPIKETVLKYVFTGDPTELESTVRMLENNYPKVVKDNLMNFLTTHDTKRVFSAILKANDDNEEVAQKIYKIASTLIFTLPGVPSIFYGDEYGMQDNDESSRGCFDWKNYKNKVYDWFLKLTKVRKLKVFKDGEMNVLYSKNGKFVFERTTKDERVVVAVNMTDSCLDLILKGNFVSFLSGEKIKARTLEKFDFDILVEQI